MDNRRMRKPRILIEPPIIPETLDKKHVGTRVQFSRSTDFQSVKDMIYDKITYLPDNITDIQITDNNGDPLEISLDDVYYFRYQLIYDSVSSPTNHPDLYTKDAFSVIASIYGDQEGFRYDHIIIATPYLKVSEENGVMGESRLVIHATGYKTIVGTGKHKYTSWVVETSDGEVVLSREKDVDNLDEFKIPMDIFKPGKLYNIKAKFISDTNGESNYGKIAYNRSIVRNDYIDISPIGELSYGKDLYFRVTAKMPNITGLTAKLYSIVGNTEVEIPVTITVNKQQIKIAPFTNIDGQYSLSPALSISNVFKLYVRPIINGNTNVVWTDMVYETFMLTFPEVYQSDPKAKYPGKYTMLKDIDLGPTIINSRELNNGIVPLIVSGSNKVRLYSKYGNSLRPTNIEFQLPADIGENTIIPYLNVLELYDGKVVFNYVCYNRKDDYKKSVWVVYNVDYGSNTWSIVGGPFKDPDEYLSSSLSSSAVTTRDGEILYIPAQQTNIQPNPDAAHIVNRYYGEDFRNNILKPYYKAESSNLGDFTIPAVSTDIKYEYDGGELIHVKHVGSNINLENALTLPIKAFATGKSNGFSIDFNFNYPTTFDASIDGDNAYHPIFSILCDGHDSWLVNMGIFHGGAQDTNLKFNIQISGGTNGENINKLFKRDHLHKITINILSNKVIVYCNEEKLIEKNHNKTLSSIDKFIIGKAYKFPNGTEFYFGNINFYNRLLTEDEIKGSRPPIKLYTEKPLSLYSLKLRNESFERTEIVNSIDQDIKLHMSLVPLSVDPGREEFLILGGTSSERVEVSSTQKGIYRYSLLNRKIRKVKRSGSSWMIEVIRSNGQDVELPRNILPDATYSISALRRTDGKIVLFSNCVYGPGSEDTSTYILDITKITSNKLEEGWFVKDNNDSRLNIPFLSTFSMKNGDFLRTSYLETLVNGGLSCKVLLYPHSPLTDYVDTDDPVTINKNLTVPAGKVISIQNPYLYDSIVIEGTSPEDTGTLIWTDINKKRVFDYTWKIITRDTIVTTAQDRAQNKEKLFILDGVSYQVQD